MSMLLILDLDGTLIDENTLTPRPHVNKLIETCQELKIDMAIWSAAGESHVETVLKELKLDKTLFKFIWNCEKCNIDRKTTMFSVVREIIVRKNLSKVWSKYKEYKKCNTLILDDTPSTFANNYGNAIPISTFTFSDKDDDKLLKVCELLKKLVELENVRHFSKSLL